MNILSTQYTLATKSFEIYVAGCGGNPHCTNCHNPESWDFNKGEEYTCLYAKKICSKIKEFNSLIDNIMIFGGEPLDQDINNLIYMLLGLTYHKKKIWLFTRYSLEEVKNKLKENIILCDYIKCGKYVPEMIVDNNIQYGIKLATSNQYIYKRGVDY